MAQRLISSAGTEAEAEDELRPDSVNSDAIDDRHDKAYEKVEESLWNYQKQVRYVHESFIVSM